MREDRFILISHVKENIELIYFIAHVLFFFTEQLHFILLATSKR